MRRKFAILLFMAVCLATAWMPRDSGRLHLMTGSADPSLEAFLRGRGAHFQTQARGFDLARDRVSFDCLYDLMQFHRRAAALSMENVEMARRGRGELPYRRRFLVMGADGLSREMESTGDFNWVYDPTHPQACRDGYHKGYVAMSDVNPMVELLTVERHNRLASAYQSALDRLGSDHPDWVAIPGEPWRGEELAEKGGTTPQPAPASPGVSFEALLRSLKSDGD